MLTLQPEDPADQVQGTSVPSPFDPPAAALPQTPVAATALRLTPEGQAQNPPEQPRQDAAEDQDWQTVNVMGKKVPFITVASLPEGRRLIELAQTMKRGEQYGFWDSIIDGISVTSLPFMGFLSNAGGSMETAKKASEAFRKAAAGEEPTLQEAIAGELVRREGAWKSEGTWGSMFGSIIAKAPGFYAEMGGIGKGLEVLRTAIASRAAASGAAAAPRILNHAALTRGVKIGMDETAGAAVDAFADAAVAEGKAATKAAAVKLLASDSAVRTGTVDYLTGIAEDLMEGPVNSAIDVSRWSPGLAHKVAAARAQTALDSAIALRSSEHWAVNACKGLAKSFRDSLVSGIVDAGSWGSEAATIVTTAHSSAGKAALQGLMDLTVGSAARGTAMFLPREAVMRPVGKAVGAVGQQQLGIEQAAWQNNDPELMSRAETMGMFLDLVEYVSEASGRGFNQLARAGGLAVAPKLMKPAVVRAGMTQVTGAKLVKDAAGELTGVNYVGLFEDGSRAEVGGVIRRFCDKLFGGRALKDNVSADRYTATVKALKDHGIAEIADPRALQQTVDSRTFAASLAPEIRAIMGTDVPKFVTDAVRAANKARLEGLKIHGFLYYYAADFLARHNIDAVKAGDLFFQMGYDGVLGEMFEERYADVLTALFGLNAEKDQSLKSRLGRAVRDLFAVDDNGHFKFRQLTAEAAGFAVPLVVRAGVMRGVAALGGNNALSSHREWASLANDVLRYDNGLQQRKGDFIIQQNAQIDRANAEAREAAERLAADAAQRTSGSAEGPLLTDNEREELRGKERSARLAAQRLSRYRDHVVESLAADVTDDTMINVAPITDRIARLSEEQYNLVVHPTDAQMRRSASAYRRLLDGAAQAGQTLFKAENPTPDESLTGFRRIAHNAASWALRLGGTLATGEVGFMTHNPAEFMGNDQGMPASLQLELKREYGRIYHDNLESMSQAGTPSAEVDIEAVHAKSLEDFRQTAADLTAAWFAAHNVYMFTDAEIADAAMQSIARDQGYYVDAEHRQFSRTVGDSTQSVSFDEFERVNHDAIEAMKREDAEKLFRTITHDTSRSADVASVVGNVIHIPKGLPTHDQAVMAQVLRLFPALRRAAVVVDVDPNKPLDDQLLGPATRQEWLDRIVDSVLPSRRIETAADYRAAMAKVESPDFDVDPALLATVARDLNIQYRMTEPGIRDRNRAVVRNALLTVLTQDPDVVMFSKPGERPEASESNPLGTPFSTFVSARRTGAEWRVNVGNGPSGIVSAATPEELADKLAPLGFSRANPRVVYASAQAVSTGSAVDMIQAIGAGALYGQRMRDAVGENDEAHLDPAYRVDPSTGRLPTPEKANADRAKEDALAALFDRNHHQMDWRLYLEPGESADDGPGPANARARMQDASDAWHRQYGEADVNGEKVPVGYKRIADALLREFGVHTPGHSVSEVADTQSRGKYVLPISMLASLGSTGNIYVRIDHEQAQDYETALLNASLTAAFRRGYSYLTKVFDTQIKDFLHDANEVMATVAADAKRQGKTDLAEDIENLRMATTAVPRRGMKRRVSPQTFSWFVSAFNLFRTEIRDENRTRGDRRFHDRRSAALGPHAAALEAVAPRIRQLPNFVKWTAAVDFVLGGDGLEGAGTNPSGRGLQMYYALFAPTEDQDFQKAVEAAFPGKSYAEWATAVTAAAHDSLHVPQQPPPQQPPPQPDGLGALRAVQAVQADMNLTPEEAIRVIDGAAPAETRSDEGGGNSAEDLLDSVPVSETREDTDDGNDDEEIAYSDDDQFAVAPLSPETTEDVLFDPSRLVEKQETQELLPSDYERSATAFGRLAMIDRGRKLTKDEFRDFVEFLVPDMRLDNRTRIVESYADLVSKNPDLSQQDGWSWQSDDEDDEGVTVDGFEGNNARAVDMLRSDALTRFLTLMQFVSPSTGKDFQPFVEDLRSSVRAAKWLAPGDDRLLKEAYDYLDGILNPRANSKFDSAPLREAWFNEQLAKMDMGHPDRSLIEMYVREAFLNSQYPSTRPTNLRAALFLSYLMGLSPNVRRQFASLISSSAPAVPMKLRRIDDDPAHPVFVMAPEPPRQGRVSMETATASFGVMANNTVENARAAGRHLVQLYAAAAARGEFATVHEGKARGIANSEGTGVFQAHAKILAAVFGADSPMVAMLTSIRSNRALLADLQARGNDSELARFGAAFSSDDPGVASPRTMEVLKVDVPAGLPLAALDVIDAVADMVEQAEAKGQPKVLLSTVKQVAVEMFQSGRRFDRHILNTSTGLRGRGTWGQLMGVYSDYKPVSVMRAEVDRERTNKPASSLAITMTGIEPALQVFMDRKDENGYEAVVRKWWPKALDKIPNLLGMARQGLFWPDARGTSIVAKSISKTAFATETLMGCRTAFQYETSDQPVPEWFQRRNMLLVPVYSGDHSSSIMLQVPLAKEFAAAGMDYDAAAELVSKWVGLDLLGADAKRSSTTSMEAPGTSLRGFRHGRDGMLIERNGEYETGHCYVGIVWNPEDGADNEAMLGETLLYGYGARRQRELSKDPRLSQVKVHISGTGGVSRLYTGMLSLIKSLSVARPDDKGGAQFVEESPNRMLMDGFGAKMVDGDEDASTGIVTDYDSVKLMLANHKAMGVDTGTGKTLALMKYVFDERLKEALAAGDVGDTLDTATLDELVGDIPWVDRTDSSRSVPAAKLSDLLPGCRLIRTTSKGGKAMYCLQFTADELMAFQVANVAHEASPTWSNMPRNYMTDMMAMSRTLSSDSRLDSVLLPGAKRNAEIAAEMVSGWGVVAAAMANDRKSVDNMLWADEEFVDMVENRGEPARRPDGTGYDGRYAAEARRRAYSSYATKHCRNLPVFAIDAALVSNDGWVDTTDGSVRCHFDNAMFRDTLQGARTIAKSERGFFQANKRAALCNLNCTAPWFRHGMYIDMEKLETEFSDRLPGTGSDDPLNPLRRAVLILESVVTDIHAGKTMDADGRTDIREKLAKCLYDHHGTYLADRTIDVMAVQKDPATGKPMRDADGRKVRVKETRHLWRSISWTDLMTKTRSAEGKRMFDRAAVYENMHDGSGKQTLYLGGTMIGVPRTPSGNGSMWMQVARAGLPVTEIVGKDSAGVVQWKSGRDAMVAPDPYTLKILGCDHDGDKAKLYMLQPDRDGHASLASVEGMFGSRTDEAARRMAVNGDGSELVQEMLADGTLEYSRRDGKDGPLQLAAQAKRELGNAMVLTLFDMYRSTPVQDVEGSVPLYTGESRDGAGRGSYYGMTKARMLPKEKWDALLAEVGDAKILDENDPRKMVGVPAVAALAQASAQRASDSRALIVSIVAALHHAYAAGVGPFAGWLGGSEEFLDFLYHMDGLSNMTFDDVKEQLCSRLGVAPGMVIPLVAHFMCSANAVGKLPTTDDEFEQAFRKYALGVRDKKSMWHWMYRFSDTGDFEAAALQASGRAEAFDLVNNKHPASKLEGSDRKIYEAVVREASRTRGQDASESVLADLYNKVATVLNQRKKHSAPAGVRWWIRVVQNDAISDADADSVVRWALAMVKLYEAQNFTRATRYAAVDPGADDVQVPEFTDQGLDAVARAFGVTSASEDENRPKPTRRDWQTVRMFAATRLFLKGQGQLLSSRGMASARGFRDNLNSAFGHYARHAEPGHASMEARFLVAASSMNRLPFGNMQMRAQANAQSIGYAASEFLTLRQMDGSPLTAENAYDVMYSMARAASAYRHGDAEPGAAHVNQTLDWRRTVEAMVDVMARFLKDSTVHKDVPVMDYLRQFSDATATSFSPAVFGPAAEDLSQTRLSLKNMSGAQLGVLHGLVRNIVENKVLDSGAERGTFTTVHGTARFTPGLYKPSDRVTFALSSASIKAMLAYARKEDEFRAKASGKTGGKKSGKSAWAGLLSETEEAKPAPSDVPLIRELELLEAVFEKMDAKYGKGFTIEPSVLFGQVLPIYATVTSRVSGPPMPGSTDLIGMFPGEYTAIARTLSRLDAGRSSARTLGIAEGLDWDPLSAVRFDETAFDYVPVGDVPSPADIARRIDAGVAAARDVTSITVDQTGEQAHVEHSQTLGIFDGNAAVAFQSMLQVLRDQVVEPAPVEPSAPPEPPAPSEAPEPVEPEPVEPIVPPVSANKPHKRDVAEMANRVGALFKMWDCGRVEYAGGDEFVIRARFHVLPGADAGATDSAYEASISVSLLPEGERLRTDDQLREMLRDNPFYLQSISQASNIPLKDLEAKSPEDQLELARRHRPVGVTSNSGTIFSIDGESVGVVSGKVTLERQPDADVVFHECFHAVMGFMQATGALGSADIAELVKRYGPSAKYGDKWFNEEAAAEDYKAFVQRNRLVEADADNVPDEKTGVFGRILAFVRDLYDVVFAGGHESRDYGNDMERNPLAGVMLTGRATASVESKVDGSFGGRLFAAVKTYIAHLDGRLARWHEIADKALTTETYVPEEIEDRFGNMVPNSKGYSRVKYAGYARRLRDEKDSAEADEIEKELAHTAFAPLRADSVFENGPARPFDEDPWLPGDPMPEADTAFFEPSGTAGMKAMRQQYRELSREALITQAAGYGVDHSMVGTILDPSNEQGFTRFLRDLEAAHALEGDPAARIAELVDRFNGYKEGRGDGYLKMVDSFLETYGPKAETMAKAQERRNESIRDLNDVNDGQEDPGNFADPVESAMTIESPKTILTNEELRIWNKAGLGDAPRILCASERTDPVFHADQIVDIIEGRKTVESIEFDESARKTVRRQLSGKQINGLYIITKGDGLPIRKLLRLPLPKLVHFSITGLGGTKWEPNVMKPDDLLDRIEEYIRQGLDPSCVTIRIDPIVPGATSRNMVEHIVERGAKMGVTNFRFSIMDNYGKVAPELRAIGYDSTRFYDKFHARRDVQDQIAAFMLEIGAKHGVKFSTCGEPGRWEGIESVPCLSVPALEKILGTKVPPKAGSQRTACGCYGGKVGGLDYSDKCPHSCAFCYAGHAMDARNADMSGAWSLYNADGTLKRNMYTVTREEDLRTTGAAAQERRRREWTLTPVKPSTARATAKDQRKFNQLGGITKFIGVGAPGTSTAHYAETAFREIANTGSYSASDIVGVSVNGAARKGVGRVPLSDPRIMKELDAATSVGATIIADEESYRNQSTFNVGEQELARELKSRGYVEQDGSGIWKPGTSVAAEVSGTVATFDGFWTRSQVAADPGRVYLFGDNTEDRKSGYVPTSTQAVIRGLPNAIGIDTKKTRRTDGAAYFTDTDFPAFKQRVDEAMALARKAIADGKTVVLPADGIGTGKAQLQKRAPKLFQYLQEELRKLTDVEPTKTIATDLETTTAPMDIWYGDRSEGWEFSNLAPRMFEHDGRLYQSVEHAYQTLKSGRYVQAVHDNFTHWGVSATKKWTAKNAPADRKTNLRLMEELMEESFRQNPAVARKLIDTGNRPFAHTKGDALWSKEFPRMLAAVRDRLRANPPAQVGTEATGFEQVAEPNEEFENQDFAAMLDSIATTVVDDEAKVMEELEGMGFSDDEMFACAATVPRVRQALRSARVERMNVPYARTNELGMAVGRAIREGMHMTDPGTRNILRSSVKRNLSDADAARMHELAAETVRRVAQVYGMDLSGGDAYVEAHVFRALAELHAGIGAGYVRPDAAKGKRDIMHAERHKGVSSPTRRPGANPDDPFNRAVTAADLAGAVLASSGVRPCDVAEAVIADIDAMARRYGPDRTFHQVLTHLRSVMETLQAEDPTGLVGGARSQDEDRMGDLLKRAGAGLKEREELADGSMTPYDVITAGSSSGKYSESNRALYADHVGTADFQKIMAEVDDALHVVAAAGKFYREIGYTPGAPGEEQALGNIPGAKDVPPPATPADAMAAMSVAPETLSDPSAEIVAFYDRPWVLAENADAWLDSIVQPTFGGVGIREAMMESRRATAGFIGRAQHLNQLDAYMYGLNAVPGTPLVAIDPDYRPEFSWRDGRMSHGRGTRNAVRFMAYDERPARKDGKPVKTDLDGIRMTDFALKARKVWFQGGRYVVTGVDGIAFSTDDFGHDESWWAWDKVQEREKAGVAGGYSDFDRALVRMHRQLSDDAERPWAAIVESGEGRYGLYDLAVKEAVAALREAEQHMASGAMSADEVNDYVLTVLDRKGVVNAVETWLPHKARHGKTSGAFKLDVEKIEKMFLESDAYRTLLDAGRTEKMLSRDEYVRPYRMLMREVKEFLAAHPYLTTGDGSFFHNLSTPLPFVQGSGYFMYMANRTANKTDARKVNEAISKFQPVLVDAVENPVNQLLPAADAGPELLKLVPLLFHVREQDVDSVREAIRRNDYRAVGGLNLTASSTQADLAKAIYLRLSGMLWHAEGTDASSRVGGLDAIRGMVLAYEKAHGQSAVLAGGSGLTDEMVHRMTGILPANHQLGHAVMNAVEGLANAYAFKASLISMMTTPDEDGMPTVFVNPREDAVEKSGIPDEIWGSCARWWAAMHGAKYDSSLTGVQNARAVYSQIAARLPKSEFGSLGPSDIDAPSVESMICRKATPIDNSSSAGYALGYAKHLMQSTRQLGGTAARATIHRAWAWSKGLSVSFSYFFPLATRFESPTGAVGALATLGGNMSPGSVRKWAKVLSRMQSLLRGKGWITKDFLGERDVRRAMDSSDPYYAELIQWAGSLGLTMSTGVKNPQEQSRGILQRDVRDVVGWVKDRFGSKKAKYVEDAANVMLLRAGDRAFTYHLNATKLAVAAQLYQKLAGEAQAAGVAFDPVRDLKGWTGYINAEIGGIDPLRYAWAHPAAQNLMNTSFFSWQWTLGAWSAGGGDAIIQAFTGRNSVTRQERSTYLMRWMRMGLEVMVGFPIMMQLLSKALGEALTAGMDPDDKDLDKETRRLVRMVRESAWFTWNNEDKARLSHFDLTPLMAGVAARFPKFADYRRNHPFAYALPVLAATAMRKPWLLLGAFPVYSGSDAANQNTRGRHVYMREGKQGWEWLAWFTHPFRQFFSKLAMPVQRLSEGIVGRSLSWLEHPQPWEGQGDLERWINPTAEGATFNLLRAFLPFSVSSLLDAGDAGFLPMMGPVSMGASGSNLVERMTTYLNQWSSNDRRGYAYGRPARFGHGAEYSHLAASRPTIAHLLQEARLNGYGEADAYKLVDAAVNKLVTPLYSDLAKALPTDPNGPFDARRVGMLLRKANRLGRLRDDLGRSVVNRLMKQNAWTTLKPDQRRAMSAAIDLMRSKNPYDISIERFRERAKARGLTLDY